MAMEEVLARQQNFRLMYSGNITQPKKRVFSKATWDTTPTPNNRTDQGISAMNHQHEEASNEFPTRVVAVVSHRQQHQAQDVKDSMGRPLSSPPRLEQREASVMVAQARRRGILVSNKRSDAPRSPAPPIGEIRIPAQPHYMSISSPCSASLPTTTHHSATDYENLYFSTVRDNHRLKQHLVLVSEENRFLKRHLIELQRRLFTARRSNNRGQQRGRPDEEEPSTHACVNEDDSDHDVRGWSVPQSSHKRIKRDDSFTMYPKVSVPQSVSSEETVVLEG